LATLALVNKLVSCAGL